MITGDRILNPTIGELKIVRGFPEHSFRKGSWTSIDTEWYKMDMSIAHRPITGKFASIQICNEDDPRTIYFLQSEFDVPSMVTFLQNTTWIMANSKFDLTHLRRLAHIPPRKALWDVQLMEEILYGGYYSSFGLQATARRWLNISLDKELQKSFDVEEMSEAQIEYACVDAFITLQVALAQKKVVTPNDFSIMKNIEIPVMFAVLDFMGARLDVDRWLELAKQHKQMSEAIDTNLTFNPRSPAQVVAYLREHGFPRLPNSLDKTLERFIRKYPETEAATLAAKVAESRGLSKRSSTYGKKFIENHIEKDIEHGNVDIIFTDYAIRGARDTGRFSSSSPNLQNVPSRDTKVFRECFIARPGNKIIIADYSQQEPRIIAQYSQDKALIKLFADTTKDIYINMVKIMWHKDIEKHDPLRKKAKNAQLGMSYGMSEHGFSDTYNISEEETHEIFEAVFKAFPEYTEWLRKQATKRNFVETIHKCKLWLNPYSSQAERNAKNAPIQGSAAEMMKLAIIEIHREWKYDKWKYPFAVILQVHDELVLDVPEDIAQEVAEFVQSKMISVAQKMCPDVVFQVSINIGNSWAEKD